MSRWLIEKAGVKITVRCRGKQAQALVEPMLQDLKARKVSASSGIRLQAKGAPGEWELQDKSSDITRKLMHAGDLIYHLSDRMVFHIADNASQVHCLHAGAVAQREKSLLIPASSGSGKSTFTAWLVANGFDYLSDELILLNGTEMDGLARPIQIKTRGVDAVKPLLIDAEEMIFGRLANAVRPESLGGQISAEPKTNLAMIIYPQYRANAGFRFEKISSANAGMNLMANHVNARNLQGHGFREMMQIIRDTPCYELEYGGFDNLPADLPEQLSAILAGKS